MTHETRRHPIVLGLFDGLARTESGEPSLDPAALERAARQLDALESDEEVAAVVIGLSELSFFLERVKGSAAAGDQLVGLLSYALPRLRRAADAGSVRLRAVVEGPVNKIAPAPRGPAARSGPLLRSELAALKPTR